MPARLSRIIVSTWLKHISTSQSTVCAKCVHWMLSAHHGPQTDDPNFPLWAYPWSPEPLLKYERSIAWQRLFDPDFSIDFAAAGSSQYNYSDQICFRHERGRRWPFLRLHGFILYTVKETAIPSIGATEDRCHSLPTILRMA